MGDRKSSRTKTFSQNMFYMFYLYNFSVKCIIKNIYFLPDHHELLAKHHVTLVKHCETLKLLPFDVAMSVLNAAILALGVSISEIAVCVKLQRYVTELLIHEI